MSVHRPQRAFEEIVHRLDRSTFHLWETEVDEDHSSVRQRRVEKECSISQFSDHGRSGSRDSVVDNPVDEEAEASGESKCGSRNESKNSKTNLMQNERCDALAMFGCAVDNASEYSQSLSERFQRPRHNMLPSGQTTIRKHTSR